MSAGAADGPTAVIWMDPRSADSVYADAERERLRGLVQLIGGSATTQPGWEALGRTEILLTGWGGPRLDAETLQRMPLLRLVLYAAGSVRGIVTPAFWASGVPLVSAVTANAISVAEHTVAQVVLALNHVHRLAASVRAGRSYPAAANPPGTYDATVGILSLGAIGGEVARRLHPFDVSVLAHDPYVTGAAVRALGAQSVGLAELFDRSEVLTVHAPATAETDGLVTPDLLRRLPPEATLINTSRGSVIDEAEMVAVLRDRTDLWALLDVTSPEPPPTNSPLYDLPNVVLTPHVAGSTGRERRRLAQCVIDDLVRYLAGEPLKHTVDQAMLDRQA